METSRVKGILVLVPRAYTSSLRTPSFGEVLRASLRGKYFSSIIFYEDCESVVFSGAGTLEVGKGGERGG